MPGSQLTRVPEGLRDLIKGLTKEVLREKPLDLYEFAAQYFETLIRERKDFKVKEFESISEYDFLKSRERNTFPSALIYSIIPVGLTELIKDFIKAVLRQRPENICAFAVEYFRNLKKIKTNETSRTDYLAFENYFKGREKFSFTPYVKCICGRTLEGMSSIYKNENEKSDDHSNVVDHTNCMTNMQLQTQLNGNGKLLVGKHVNITQKSKFVFDEKVIRAVYTIQRFFRHYIIKKKTAHKRNFQEKSEQLRYEKNEDKQVLHPDKGQQNSVSEMLKANEKNIFKNEHIEVLKNLISCEDKNSHLKVKNKDKFDLTEDLNKQLINNNSSQKPAHISGNDLNKEQLSAVPEKKLLIQTNNHNKDEKLGRVLIHEISNNDQKYNKRSTEIESNKIAEKSEINYKNQHIIGEGAKEDRDRSQVKEAKTIAGANIEELKKELKNKNDYPEKKMSEEDIKASNEIKVENLKDSESEVKKIRITSGSNNYKTEGNAYEQKFKDNLKNSRDNMIIEEKSSKKQSAETDMKTIDHITDNGYDMKTREKILSAPDTKENPGYFIDNELKKQSNVIDKITIEKDIFKETIKKTVVHIEENELVRVSSEFLSESFNTNTSTNIKSVNQQNTTHKSETQKMHSEIVHKENEKEFDKHSLNVLKDNEIVEKVIEGKTKEDPKTESNSKASDEKPNEEVIKELLPETRKGDLKVDKSNQEENILINTQPISEMRNSIKIKEIEIDQNKIVSEDIQTKETNRTTEKISNNKEIFFSENKSIKKETIIQKENEENIANTYNNDITATDNKTEENHSPKEITKNEAKDEVKDAKNELISTKNMVSSTMNTELEKSVHTASAEDPKSTNLQIMHLHEKKLSEKANITVENDENTETKKGETYFSIKHNSENNVNDLIVTEKTINLVEQNEISEDKKPAEQEFIENENNSKENSNNLTFEEKINKNEKQKQVKEEEKTVNHKDVKLNTLLPTEKSFKSLEKSYADKFPNDKPNESLEINTQTKEKIVETKPDDKTKEEQQNDNFDEKQKILMISRVEQSDPQQLNSEEKDFENQIRNEEIHSNAKDNSSTLTIQNNKTLKTLAKQSKAVISKDNEENSYMEVSKAKKVLNEIHRDTTSSDEILERDLQDERKESKFKKESAALITINKQKEDKSTQDQTEAKVSPSPSVEEYSQEATNVKASTATTNSDGVLERDLQEEKKDSNFKDDLATLELINKQGQNKVKDDQTGDKVAPFPPVEKAPKEILTARNQLTENRSHIQNSNKVLYQDLQDDKNDSNFKDDLTPLTNINKLNKSKDTKDQTEAKGSPFPPVQEASNEIPIEHKDTLHSDEILERDLKDEKTDSNINDESTPLVVIEKQGKNKVIKYQTETEDSSFPAVEENSKEIPTATNALTENYSDIKNTNEIIDQDLQGKKEYSNLKDNLASITIINKENQSKETKDLTESKVSPSQSVEGFKDNTNIKAPTTNSDNHRVIENADEIVEREIKDEKKDSNPKDDLDPLTNINKQSKNKVREDQTETGTTLSSVEEASNENTNIKAERKTNSLIETHRNANSSDEILKQDLQDEKKNSNSKDDSATVLILNKQSQGKATQDQTEAKVVSSTLSEEEIKSSELSTSKYNSNHLTLTNNESILESSMQIKEKHATAKDDSASLSIQKKESQNKVSEDLTDPKYSQSLSLDDFNKAILSETKLKTNNNTLTSELEDIKDLDETLENKAKQDVVSLSLECNESLNKMTDDQTKSEALQSLDANEDDSGTFKDTLNKEVSLTKNMLSSKLIDVENTIETFIKEKDAYAKEYLASISIGNDKNTNKMPDEQPKPRDLRNPDEIFESSNQNKEKDANVKDDLTTASAGNIENSSKTIDNKIKSGDLHSKSHKEDNKNDTSKDTLSKEISKVNNSLPSNPVNARKNDKHNEQNADVKDDLAHVLVEYKESSDKTTGVQNKREVLESLPAENSNKSDNSHKTLSNEILDSSAENNAKDIETKTQVLKSLIGEDDFDGKSLTLSNEVLSSAVAKTNKQSSLKDPDEILESSNQSEEKDSNHNDKSASSLMRKNENPKKITDNKTKSDVIKPSSANENIAIDALKEISSNVASSVKDSKESLEGNTNNNEKALSAELNKKTKNEQEKFENDKISKISTHDNGSDGFEISIVNEQLPQSIQQQITKQGPMNIETASMEEICVFKRGSITDKETSQENLNTEVVIGKQSAPKVNEFSNVPINQVKKTTKDQHLEKDKLQKGRFDKSDIIKDEKQKINSNSNKKSNTEKTIPCDNLNKTLKDTRSLNANIETIRKNESSVENDESDLNNKTQHKKPTRLCQIEGVKNEFIEQKYIQYPIAEIYLKSFKVPQSDNTIIQDPNKEDTSNISSQKSHNNSISSEVSHQENETEFSDSLNDENFERDSLEVGSSKETDIEEDSIEIEKQLKLNDQINEAQQLNLVTERMPTYLYGIQTVEESNTTTQEKQEKSKKSIAFVIPFENNKKVKAKNHAKVETNNIKQITIENPNVSVEKAVIDSSIKEKSDNNANEDEENITLDENSPQESRLQTIFEQNEYDSPRQEEAAENKLGDFIFPEAKEVYDSKENLNNIIAFKNETVTAAQDPSQPDKINETLVEKKMSVIEEPQDSFNDISSLSDNESSESSTFTTSREFDETVLSDENYNLRENFENSNSILKHEKLNKSADTTPKGGIYEIDTKNLSVMLSNEIEKLKENALEHELETELEKIASDAKTEVQQPLQDQNQDIIKETENFLKIEKKPFSNSPEIVSKKEDFEIMVDEIKSETESLTQHLKDAKNLENTATINKKPEFHKQHELETKIEKKNSDAITQVQQPMQDQNQNYIKETENFLKVEKNAHANVQEAITKKDDFEITIGEIKSEAKSLTQHLKDVKNLENTATINKKPEFHQQHELETKTEKKISDAKTLVQQPMQDQNQNIIKETENFLKVEKNAHANVQEAITKKKDFLVDEIKSETEMLTQHLKDVKNLENTATIITKPEFHKLQPKDGISYVKSKVNSELEEHKLEDTTNTTEISAESKNPDNAQRDSEKKGNQNNNKDDLNQSTVPEIKETNDEIINEQIDVKKSSLMVPKLVTSGGENINDSIKLKKDSLKEKEDAKSREIKKEIETENIPDDSLLPETIASGGENINDSIKLKKDSLKEKLEDAKSREAIKEIETENIPDDSLVPGTIASGGENINDSIKLKKDSLKEKLEDAKSREIIKEIETENIADDSLVSETKASGGKNINDSIKLKNDSLKEKLEDAKSREIIKEIETENIADDSLISETIASGGENIKDSIKLQKDLFKEELETAKNMEIKKEIETENIPDDSLIFETMASGGKNKNDSIKLKKNSLKEKLEDAKSREIIKEIETENIADDSLVSETKASGGKNINDSIKLKNDSLKEKLEDAKSREIIKEIKTENIPDDSLVSETMASGGKNINDSIKLKKDSLKEKLEDAKSREIIKEIKTENIPDDSLVPETIASGGENINDSIKLKKDSLEEKLEDAKSRETIKEIETENIADDSLISETIASGGENIKDSIKLQKDLFKEELETAKNMEIKKEIETENIPDDSLIFETMASGGKNKNDSIKLKKNSLKEKLEDAKSREIINEIKTENIPDDSLVPETIASGGENINDSIKLKKDSLKEKLEDAKSREIIKEIETENIADDSLVSGTIASGGENINDSIKLKKDSLKEKLEDARSREIIKEIETENIPDDSLVSEAIASGGDNINDSIKLKKDSLKEKLEDAKSREIIKEIETENIADDSLVSETIASGGENIKDSIKLQMDLFKEELETAKNMEIKKEIETENIPDDSLIFETMANGGKNKNDSIKLKKNSLKEKLEDAKSREIINEIKTENIPDDSLVPETIASGGENINDSIKLKKDSLKEKLEDAKSREIIKEIETENIADDSLVSGTIASGGENINDSIKLKKDSLKEKLEDARSREIIKEIETENVPDDSLVSEAIASGGDNINDSIKLKKDSLKEKLEDAKSREIIKEIETENIADDSLVSETIASGGENIKDSIKLQKDLFKEELETAKNMEIKKEIETENIPDDSLIFETMASGGKNKNDSIKLKKNSLKEKLEDAKIREIINEIKTENIPDDSLIFETMASGGKNINDSIKLKNDSLKEKLEDAKGREIIKEIKTENIPDDSLVSETMASGGKNINDSIKLKKDSLKEKLEDAKSREIIKEIKTENIPDDSLVPETIASGGENINDSIKLKKDSLKEKLEDAKSRETIKEIETENIADDSLISETIASGGENIKDSIKLQKDLFKEELETAKNMEIKKEIETENIPDDSLIFETMASGGKNKNDSIKLKKNSLKEKLEDAKSREIINKIKTENIPDDSLVPETIASGGENINDSIKLKNDSLKEKLEDAKSREIIKEIETENIQDDSLVSKTMASGGENINDSIKLQKDLFKEELETAKNMEIKKEIETENILDDSLIFETMASGGKNINDSIKLKKNSLKEKLEDAKSREIIKEIKTENIPDDSLVPVTIASGGENINDSIKLKKDSLKEKLEDANSREIIKEIETENIPDDSLVSETMASGGKNINDSIKLKKDSLKEKFEDAKSREIIKEIKTENIPDDSLEPETIASVGENKNDSIKLKMDSLKEKLEDAKSRETIKEIETENIPDDSLVSETMASGGKNINDSIKLKKDFLKEKLEDAKSREIIKEIKTENIPDDSLVPETIASGSENINDSIKLKKDSLKEKLEDAKSRDIIKKIETENIPADSLVSETMASGGKNINDSIKLKKDSLKEKLEDAKSRDIIKEIETGNIPDDSLVPKPVASGGENINESIKLQKDLFKEELETSKNMKIKKGIKTENLPDDNKITKTAKETLTNSTSLEHSTNETKSDEKEFSKSKTAEFDREQAENKRGKCEKPTISSILVDTDERHSEHQGNKINNNSNDESLLNNQIEVATLKNILELRKPIKTKHEIINQGDYQNKEENNFDQSCDEIIITVIENDDFKQKLNNSASQDIPLEFKEETVIISENKINKKLTADEIRINEILQQLPTPPQHSPSSNSVINESTNLPFLNDHNEQSKENNKNKAAFLIQQFFKNYLTKELNNKQNDKTNQQDLNENTSTPIENDKVNWFVGEDPIISKNIISQQTHLETIGTLDKHQEQNFEHAPQVYPINIGLQTNDVLVNQLISQEQIVSAEVKPESDKLETLGYSPRSIETLKDTEKITFKNSTYDKKGDSKQIANEPINEAVLNETKKIINSERQLSGKQTHANIEQFNMDNAKLKQNKFCKTELTKSFLQSEIEFSTYDKYSQVIEEPCIKRNFTENVINEIEAETEAEVITQENADNLNNKVVIDAVERILQKPEELIQKMQRRRSLEVDSTSNKGEQSFDQTSFDDPVIKTLESIVGSRNSSAEDTDEVVIISPSKQVDETKSYLKRFHTIAGDDTRGLSKSVTIDETIKYIELTTESETTTTSVDSFCLDEDTSENIRKKMMAYSLSEADSELFNSPVANYSVSFDVPPNDFDINTALKKTETTSTETESTIVSAATKIQAGARGFLTRRRLRRASSAGSKSSFYDGTRDSFGNNAISESLETMVEHEAARKIQKAFRNHRQNQFKSMERSAGNISHESSLAAKRLTLQRGDAVRNNSSPEEDNSKNKKSKAENNTIETFLSNSSESGYKEIEEKILSDISTKNKTDHDTKSNELKWIKFRQNSMPVQIDSEIFRIIPKHKRKEINSAGESKKHGRRFPHD